MPLLKKKEFHKIKTQNGYSDNEEVFHCAMTNEIFRDYDEFCTRVILCNSMVWTCKFTGKSGLTYSEALESESHANKLFRDFPTELRIPVLFIATKTQRSSFIEMLEDIYGYTKDRYFIGENVEASFDDNKWHESHILQVIAPQADKTKKSPRNGQTQCGPQAISYHYEVEQMDVEDPDLSEVMIVNYDRIRRRKKLSRDRLKMFLKRYIEQSDLGVFIIKPSVLQKFGIHKVLFNQIFDGPIPTFDVSKKLVKNAKQASLVPFLNSKNNSNNNKSSKDSKNKSTSNGLSANSLNLLEKMKKRQEDFEKEKAGLKQKKIEEKIRQRQENLKIQKMLKEWHKPKNDLELEDHKMLPVLPPVYTQIPNEDLGDVFAILEFVKTFSKFLSVKNFFPGNITLEILERAFVEKEVAGPLVDLIQMFLIALFQMEINEASECDMRNDPNSKIKTSSDGNLNLTEASHIATFASKWASRHQGFPLTNLALDAFTTSEILRLHLLSSGARKNDAGTIYRYQERGGYCNEEDPGLYLCVKYPHIIKLLSLHCVTELPNSDILKIIDCLMSQLLTYSDLRNFIEEHLETSKQNKSEYKSEQINVRKDEQEFMAAKLAITKECITNNTDATEQLEKLTANFEGKKAQTEKKLNKLKILSNKCQPYLGQDRAFRKYFKLESVPGIFVNFEEDNPGSCYEECVQQNPDLINADKTEIISHLRKVLKESNTSDKENSLNTSIVNGEVNSNEAPNDSDKLLMCNTNPNTCIVHSQSASRERWSFFSSVEQFDAFTQCFNSRGLQESELKQNFTNERKYLQKLIESTSLVLKPKAETPEKKAEVVKSETPDETEVVVKPKPETTIVLRNLKDKSIVDDKNKIQHKNIIENKYKNATLGYPKELSTALILQYSLVENILEMEEKIFNGHLGAIKVTDRSEWRKALTNHQYDSVEVNLEINQKFNSVKENCINDTSGGKRYFWDPGRYFDDLIEAGSSSNTCEQSSLTHSAEHTIAIQSLACALAQIAEGVSRTLLKQPLGYDRHANKNKCDYLVKWERCLLDATSYGQIFLHYSTLDLCIKWSRSTFLPPCKVCRKSNNARKLLICVNCNKGLHFHCHNPKILSVPEGNWLCKLCLKRKEHTKLQDSLTKPNNQDIDESSEVSEVDDCLLNGADKVNYLKQQQEESSDQSEDYDRRVTRARIANRREKLAQEDGSEHFDGIFVNGTGQKTDTKAKLLVENEKRNSKKSNKRSRDLTDDDSDFSDYVKQKRKRRIPIIDDESEFSETTFDVSKLDNSQITDKSDEKSYESQNITDEPSEEETSQVEKNDKFDGVISNKKKQRVSKKIPTLNVKLQIGHINGDKTMNGDESTNGDETINDDQIIEVCEKCGLGGTLLCCENCPDLYHLECTNPPLRRIPRGDWFCQKCTLSKKKEDTDDDWYLNHSVVQRSGNLQNQRRCIVRSGNSMNGIAKFLRRISKYADNSRRSFRRDDLPLNNSQLQEVLTDVMKQDFSWPFLRPVNKNEVPDYYNIIDHPMDFGTIKYKLNMGQYKYDADLMADVVLVFENCNLYNNSEDEVYQCGLKMLQYFVNKCRQLGLHVPLALENVEVFSNSSPSTQIELEDKEMQLD